MKLSPNHDSFRRVDESEKAKNIHNTKQLVLSILDEIKESRDNNQVLMFHTWGRQRHQLTSQIEDIEKASREGLIAHSETIRRASCEHQKKYPHLRGKNWKKNQSHNHKTTPNLFSYIAKSALTNLANHPDCIAVCRDEHTHFEWRDNKGRVWAKEKNGIVYFPKSELSKIELKNCISSCLSEVYTESRIRVTGKRGENPKLCFEIPLVDVQFYLQEGA